VNEVDSRSVWSDEHATVVTERSSFVNVEYAAERELSHADVVEAARYLDGQIVRTPVVGSAELDRTAGAQLLVKAENLQLSGSYKMRGATAAVGRTVATGPVAGVVCQSTGNHAVAVALAARKHGLPAIVVLPADAPAAKVARARAAGALVIRPAGDPHDEVRRISAETGYTIIDAYDHPDVVAGQGTAALELIETAESAGTPLDGLVIPVGGGGGAAGAVLAAVGRGIDVYGVEPVGCASLAQSLAAGRRVRVDPAPTLADGLRPARVGALPFRILRDSGIGVVQVGDDAIADAFRLVLTQLKLVAEPSGAAGLAGALRVAALGIHQRVGVVLTGGNVDADLVGRLMKGSHA
jgi:threonine dehydratase